MEADTYKAKASSDYKWIALEKLKGNWENAVIIEIIALLLTNGINWTVNINHLIRYGLFSSYNLKANFGSFIGLIIDGPIRLGITAYFLNLLRDEKAKIEDLFSGFSSFGKALELYILTGILKFVLFLLLIVPGIIASIKYSMSFYILHDYPELTAEEAFDRSIEMMDGEKMRFFKLWLSFLGWFIFGMSTLGIGFIWITPYYNAAKTAFYEDLKARKDITN